MPDTILGLRDNHREHNYLKTLSSWNLHSNYIPHLKTTLLPLSPFYRGAKWGSENLCSLSGFSQPELNPVLLDSKAWASSSTNSVAGPATKTKVLLSQTTFCQGYFFFFNTHRKSAMKKLWNLSRSWEK